MLTIHHIYKFHSIYYKYATILNWGKVYIFKCFGTNTVGVVRMNFEEEDRDDLILLEQIRLGKKSKESDYKEGIWHSKGLEGGKA